MRARWSCAGHNSLHLLQPPLPTGTLAIAACDGRRVSPSPSSNFFSGRCTCRMSPVLRWRASHSRLVLLRWSYAVALNHWSEGLNARPCNRGALSCCRGRVQATRCSWRTVDGLQCIQGTSRLACPAPAAAAAGWETTARRSLCPGGITSSCLYHRPGKGSAASGLSTSVDSYRDRIQRSSIRAPVEDHGVVHARAVHLDAKRWSYSAFASC